MGTEQALFCRVGTRVCALPLPHVVETMRPLPVEPIAGAPAFVLGLAIVRGAPTPVVDAALLLGATRTAQAGRFVTLRAGDRFVSLAVDAVIAIRPLEGLGDRPPLLREASAGIVSQIGRLDRELLVVLETARLVPEDVLVAAEVAR